MVFPFGGAPDESTEWDKRLRDAFAKLEMKSGFLPLAEEALSAFPGDPYILCFAATAALLDQRPERARWCS
jgi:hypothetical protein